MLKRPKISKHELIADLIFLLVSMSVTFIAIFVFDIHWSFYPQNIGKGIQSVFQSPTPYLILMPIGGIVGLFVFKLIFFAFVEEEKAVEETKKGKKSNRNKL
ncbi:MAG: hypothetical protein ABII22_00195 [Candidatus Micrarchaeota archaeon]